MEKEHLPLPARKRAGTTLPPRSLLPMGTHHSSTQAVRHYHLRPFNYAAPRRSPPQPPCSHCCNTQTSPREMVSATANSHLDTCLIATAARRDPRRITVSTPPPRDTRRRPSAHVRTGSSCAAPLMRIGIHGYEEYSGTEYRSAGCTEEYKMVRGHLEQSCVEESFCLEGDIGGGLVLQCHISILKDNPKIVQIDSSIQARSVGPGSGGFSRILSAAATYYPRDRGKKKVTTRQGRRSHEVQKDGRGRFLWRFEQNSCGKSEKNACGRSPPFSLRVTIVEISNFFCSCV